MIEVRDAKVEELNQVIAWQAKRIMQLESELDQSKRSENMWFQDFNDLNKKWQAEHPENSEITE